MNEQAQVIRVKAKDLREGDQIVYNDSQYTDYIDDVQFTRDGDVKVIVGFDGSGVLFYEQQEFVWITRG